MHSTITKLKQAGNDVLTSLLAIIGRRPSSRSECAASYALRTPRGRAMDFAVVWMTVAVLALSIAGCQSPNAGPIPPEWKAQTPGALAPGDVLKLTFPGATELNQLQKVRPDGNVSLPMLGEIHVGGMQLGDLQRELTRRYKPQLKNSEVVVAVESSTNVVYVGGAVIKPGKVVIERPMTALEAVMEAGGFVPDLANPRKVSVIREVKGQHTTYVVDLSPSLHGRSSEAFYLKAFDVIYVPQAGFHF